MNDGRSVVVVEDDPAHRDLITHLLGLVAPRARVAQMAATETDDLADQAPFGSLVLLDRRLGSLDSLELVAPLLRARPDLEIVIMSAFVTAEDRVACLHAGAASVFEKPGDLNGWRSTLLALLGAGGRDEARAA